MSIQIEKSVRIGGRSHASGAMPVVQRVVARVLHFHQLCPGKFKWEMHVGSELRDMCLWCFLCIEDLNYFPEGVLVVWDYLCVSRALLHNAFIVRHIF